MIKQIIFDLDGVIINSREMHFKAFSHALMEVCPEYSISKEEHLSTYDALPTTKKLELLSKNKGLPKKLYNKIWQEKQKITMILLEAYQKDEKLGSILQELKDQGFSLSVASNSIRQSVIAALHNKKVLHYFSHILSNEDVLRAKPNPEMYYKIMIQTGIPAVNTLILEDSNTGREAVLKSGAHP